MEMARALKDQQGDRLLAQSEDEAVTTCARYAAGLIIEGIRQDLLDFGVSFDQWFSEQSLYDSAAGSAPASQPCAKKNRSTKKTAPSGLNPPTSGTKKTGWWCATTVSRPILPRTSPTTRKNSSAALTG
jgi:hypothetical protein